MIVPQQTAEPLATYDFAIKPTNIFTRLNDPVGQSLMIPFAVVMCQELLDSVAQGTFAKWNQPIETFGFQRQEEPIKM